MWCYVLRDGRPGPNDFTFDCVATHVWTTFGGHLCITCHEELVTGDLVQLRCTGEFVPKQNGIDLYRILFQSKHLGSWWSFRFSLPLLFGGVDICWSGHQEICTSNVSRPVALHASTTGESLDPQSLVG